MTVGLPEAGMVGPFWIVEEAGEVVIVALAVPLSKATLYGDMLTVETGHLQHWSRLGRRGAAALRAVGLPTAPVWSEYEEWPRGRVLYDGVARQFVIRADRQLHQPAFLRLVREHFCIGTETMTFWPMTITEACGSSRCRLAPDVSAADLRGLTKALGQRQPQDLP